MLLVPLYSEYSQPNQPSASGLHDRRPCFSSAGCPVKPSLSNAAPGCISRLSSLNSALRHLDLDRAGNRLSQSCILTPIDVLSLNKTRLPPHSCRKKPSCSSLLVETRAHHPHFQLRHVSSETPHGMMVAASHSIDGATTPRGDGLAGEG